MPTPVASSRLVNYEQILHDGILAAKNDRRDIAYSLLNQAIELNGTDARPYVWLAEISDDPQEKISYLEQAVVLDPNNAAARRELAVLTGKIAPQEVLPIGHSSTAVRTEGGLEAQAQSFTCPQCGGRMSFSILATGLACPFCGFVGNAAPVSHSETVADRAEQVLDFVLPTASGHDWAENQKRVACGQCGALTILPAELKSAECPYCGSNQFVLTAAAERIVDPQVIALMKLDARQVAAQVKSWLGKGMLAPDDLLRAVQRIRLRPAYYSFWTFDGTVEVRWSCEVKEGSGRYAIWVNRDGVESSFFDDILVPGMKALEPHDLEMIEPFNLKEVLEFKPEQVVGWPTLIYNRSLAEASLMAREQVTRKVRATLSARVEAGREKRNFQTRGSGWSGMTFKHVLLPLWTGMYRYKGKDFRLLVNGQTGKVGGEKPTDRVKALVGFLTVSVALFLVIWFLLWLWNNSGNFHF
jgi:DNA-directed RNA polymerase subunit RPC12/RpoP